MPDIFEVSVKGLVYNKDAKLLLMKDEKGLWDLPGGRINHGEDFEKAVKREVSEELGVDCELLDRQPKLAWPAQNDKGQWRVNICFLIRLKSDAFKKSDENVEHGYFSKEELKALDLTEHLKPLLEHL